MKVYEESGCFDPHSITDFQDLMGLPGATNSSEDNLNLSSYHHHHQEDVSAAAAMDMETHQHYLLDNTTATNNSNAHLIPYLTQELSYDQSNWEAFNMIPSSSSAEAAATGGGGYTPTPDLLSLFHLPRCSFLPNSFISFETTPGSPPVVYDPLFHLNLPPQPPVFMELLQSLPHGYAVPAEDKDAAGAGGLYHDGDNGMIEFTRDISMAGRTKDRDKTGKTTKHFATERERRVHLNDKFQALRTMVPSPTKNDRASIVGDAIDYIKELIRSVHELKILVEKKRCGQDRSKRLKAEDASSAADAGDVDIKPDPDQCYNTSLRSSWLQRKSKDSEVNVRIIDDEVTIKLVQRKKINCLLFVSRLLDELQLDLHHVAGGNIGDYYSFLFNTKIYEGSSVYASAIANKLIDVVDRQYAAVPPTSNNSL
ncbi:pentatricopeptide repeat-containing protein [Hibiscus syriacus]|uniref:Pentatricopeptide repeat-containing protein n=1 Tax=Hibiscus syriacus TaxID=106335 RepID=A0A6A3C965_HIBSY|nr:transcription factor bHLH91-like [Hibiscus syriacus]KAE8724361.1 pentatricopeptide repeat-containing protein [Hibiscus syriacus]